MENKTKLKKIIAAYNPFSYHLIDLSKTIKDRYVANEFKDSFADDICNTWESVDCTKMHNDMFTSLNTGEDILKIVNKVTQ